MWYEICNCSTETPLMRSCNIRNTYIQRKTQGNIFHEITLIRAMGRWGGMLLNPLNYKMVC